MAVIVKRDPSGTARSTFNSLDELHAAITSGQFPRNSIIISASGADASALGGESFGRGGMATGLVQWPAQGSAATPPALQPPTSTTPPPGQPYIPPPWTPPATTQQPYVPPGPDTLVHSLPMLPAPSGPDTLVHSLPMLPASSNPLPKIPGMPDIPVPPSGGVIPPVTPQPLLPGQDQTAVQPYPQVTNISTPQTPVNVSTVPNQDISPYVPLTSQQQQEIIKQAIAQSRGVATDNLAQMRSVIDPYIQDQFKSFTDPKGSGYQSTIGQLNNIGMADSGAFPQALADKLAPLISQGAYQLGAGTLLPSFLNQQDLVTKGAGAQSTLGMEPLNRMVEMANWNLQKDTANQLAQQGASAQFGSGIGGLLGGGLGAVVGNSIVPGIGGLTVGALLGSQGGNAVGGGSAGMSWICGHLKKLNLATQEEVEAVDAHLRPTMLRHPIHWLYYLFCAPRLIVLADRQGIDWKEVRPVLIDAILAEPDSEKAWQLYRAECQRLCDRYAPDLWPREVSQWA